MVLFTCFQFLFLFLLFSFPSQKICTNIFFFLSEISFTYNNINTCTPTTATPLMASSPALRAVQLMDLHGWLFPNPKILHGQRRVPPLNEPTELPIQHFGCVSLQPKRKKEKEKGDKTQLCRQQILLLLPLQPFEQSNGSLTINT